MINKNAVVTNLTFGDKVVDIKISGPMDLADLTVKYLLEFSCNGMKRAMNLELPKMDGNSFIFNGNQFVGIDMAIKPIVTVEGEAIKDRKVFLNPIYPKDPTFMFGVNSRGTVTMWVIRPTKNGIVKKPFSRIQIIKDRITGEFKMYLRPNDRADFNALTGSNDTMLYITAADIDFLMEWFTNPEKQIPNWKDINYLRVMTLEDMMAECLNSVLRKELVSFHISGAVDIKKIENAFYSWLDNSPQIQLDDNDQELAKLSLRTKVRLPIDHYDTLKTARHDPSWAHVFCGVHTPQSSDAGAITHYVEGASIKNGRFIPDPECRIYSALLHRSLPFPGFIQANRQVMVGAIAEQTCKLGPNGTYDQLPMVDTKCDSTIPMLSGKNIVMALMDWDGYTHEDACVISKSMAKVFTTDVIVKQVVSSHGPLGDKEYLDGGAWLIQPGDTVRKGTILAHTILPPEVVKVDIIGEDQCTLESNASRQIRAHGYSSNLTGTVLELTTHSEIRNGILMYRNEVIVKCTHFCDKGSKLAGRHSNKHIVSKVVEDKDMPFFHLPNGKRVQVDMVASPMTVGGRMNPSLVLEMMYGFAHAFGMDRGSRHEYQQFDEDNSFEAASGWLDSEELPEHCMFNLTIGDRILPNPTLVGVCFVSRLHHHAPDKLRMSDDMEEDMYDTPRYGYGAQGLAREECEVLIQHEAWNCLKEVSRNSRDNDGRARLNGLLETLGYQMVTNED